MIKVNKIYNINMAKFNISNTQPSIRSPSMAYVYVNVYVYVYAYVYVYVYTFLYDTILV